MTFEEFKKVSETNYRYAEIMTIAEHVLNKKERAEVTESAWVAGPSVCWEENGKSFKAYCDGGLYALEEEMPGYIDNPRRVFIDQKSLLAVI